MSAFEDFVQLELPKRPYLNADVAQETVIVRRGPGPRQLSAVELDEGQVLGKVGGVLTGITIGAGATFKKHAEAFTTSTAWEVSHNQNSTVYLAPGVRRQWAGHYTRRDTDYQQQYNHRNVQRRDSR